jgi:hypothetical protein
MSQVNIPLPWIPRPYPDEVFGSWIGRIMMSNGAGQFRLFLSGFGGTQQGIVRLLEARKSQEMASRKSSTRLAPRTSRRRLP